MYAVISEFAERLGANRTVMALSIARLGDALGNSILFIVLPIYVANLPSPWLPLPTTLLVGILISAFGIVNSGLQPYMGGWVDRVPKRKYMIQLGLAVMMLSTFGFVFADRFTSLLLLRGIQGVGIAMTIPASMALITASTKQATRGGSMGIYSSMRIVGFAMGPLLGGWLYDTYGFNATFYAGAAAIFVGLLAVQFLVHEPATEKPAQPRKQTRFFDRTIITPGILGAGIATFAMASAFSMITTLENEFTARLNMSAFAFGVAFSILMVSRLLTQVPLGRLSDRIGRKPLIIGGLILIAPATALLGFVTTEMQLNVLRVAQGVASAAVAAPAFALAGDLATTGNEGRQMSIVTMGFGLGTALGPLIAGALGIFSFSLPFIVGGLMALAGAWVVYRYTPETVTRHAETRQPFGQAGHSVGS